MTREASCRMPCYCQESQVWIILNRQCGRNVVVYKPSLTFLFIILVFDRDKMLYGSISWLPDLFYVSVFKIPTAPFYTRLVVGFNILICIEAALKEKEFPL